MNQNLDRLYCQLVDWLKQLSETHPSSSERGLDLEFNTVEEEISMAEQLVESLDPLTWEEEELNKASAPLDELHPQPFTMGEIPIVQKRFQALLKRKLYDRIERKPPLFPWETEVSIYEPEFVSERSVALIPSREMWLPQLTELMPTFIPEKILSQLLDACTEAMGSVRPQSAKMVNAVKEVFPEYTQLLNEMVGRIRLSPSFAASRLSKEEQQKQRQQLASLLPGNYTEASLEQQMAISLLVAKEILETLSLVLSPRQSSIERLWNTRLGVVRLGVDYDSQKCDRADLWVRSPLRVRAHLPKGGSLTLQANQESITATRTYSGALSVELSDWQIGQTYLLEVRLSDPQQRPLHFALTCKD